MTTKARKRRKGGGKARAAAAFALPEVSASEDALSLRLSQRAERLHEEEDDLHDGRSSAGLTMRAEEDAWGHDPAQEGRPYPEWGAGA